jgi:hypothetical protein
VKVASGGRATNSVLIKSASGEGTPGAGTLHAVAGNVLIMEQDRILREALTV